MVTIFFVFLGLIIGGLLAEEEGVVVGLFIGLAFAMIATLKGRIFQLDQDLSRTIKLLNNARSGQDDAAQSQEFESEEIVDTRLFSVQFSAVTPARFNPSIDDTPIPLNPASTTSRGEEGSNKTLTNWHNASSQQSTQKRTNEPDFAQKVFFTVRNFFATGNITSLAFIAFKLKTSLFQTKYP
jgi:hypothetical protein